MPTKKPTKEIPNKDTKKPTANNMANAMTKTVRKETVKRVMIYARRFRSIDILVYDNKVLVYADSINTKDFVDLVFNDIGTMEKVKVLLRPLDIEFAKRLLTSIYTLDKRNAEIIMHQWLNSNKASILLTILAKAGIKLRKLLFDLRYEGIRREAIVNWLLAIFDFYNIRYSVRVNNNITIITVPTVTNNLFGHRKTLMVNLLSIILSNIAELRRFRVRFVNSGVRQQ